MTRPGFWLASALLVLLGSGCLSASSLPAERPDTASVSSKLAWEELEPGLARLAFKPTSTEAEILLYRFAPAQFSWRFAHSTSAKSIAAWQKSLALPTAVANGVYFHEDFLPSGTLVTSGKAASERVFDLDKSAAFSLDGDGLRIFATASGEPAPRFAQEWAQSYPLLLKDGTAAVEEDSGKTARRTFVATDSKGNGYLGIVPMGELTLYQLARLLADPRLNLDRALNLDGGPSSGIAIHAGSHMEVENSFTAVPNVIVITKNNQQ